MQKPTKMLCCWVTVYFETSGFGDCIFEGPIVDEERNANLEPIDRLPEYVMLFQFGK